MKKTLILLVIMNVFMFTACDSIPTEVIDTADVDYQLVSISVPAQFIYNDQDSTLSVTLSFKNSSTISRVWFNVLTVNASSTIKQNVYLSQGASNNDVTSFTGNTILGKGIPTGQYVLEFFVEDNITAGNGKVKKVASHNLEFLSGQQNSAPVISNLVAPDSIVVEDPRSLIELHINVDDQNGLLDIDEVYFNVFGPGSTTGNKVSMFDDGQEANGDVTANDGIYSRIIEITPTNTKGEYRFEFEAVDRVGALSNKIIHILTVK